MVRTVAAKARKAIVKAAQRSAEKIRTVAGDAAGVPNVVSPTAKTKVPSTRCPSAETTRHSTR